MITLALDASTYAGSVAVLDGSRVLAEDSVAMKGAQQERLMPAVADVLAKAGLAVRDVGRVVCGEGPGSFTSLRIAGGIAKGIASGTGCPLFALPSLALIIAGMPERRAGRYLAALDALRGELYVALYEVTASGAVRQLDGARVIAASGVEGAAESAGARLVGPAHGELGPQARGVALLEGWLEERGPVDLAGWEPVYGRLAEAQVRWESAHGRPLPSA
jgi:tRNA threonylcarbamoyladenosine biosynthesis protein TsaB